MKRLVPILAFIICTGCGIFDNDNGTPTPAFSAQRYFPLRVGSAWTYRLTATDSLGNPTNLTFINSVAGTIRRNNRTYTIVFDSSRQDSLLVRLQNNIIYSLRQVGVSTVFRPASRTVPLPVRAKPAQQLVLREVPYIDFNVKIGQSWVLFAQVDSIQGFVISQDIRGDFIGQETVQVPAGTFTDCLHYRITETTSIRSNIFTNSTADQENLWLAPDIGKVRRTHEFRENNVLQESSTEEVISIAIPQ